MRATPAILLSLLLAAIWLFSSMAAVNGEENPPTDLRREAFREWFSIARGRTEFDLSDPGQVPSQLVLAAKESGCLHENRIRERPIRFFRFAERRLALVFCEDIVGSDQLFDLSNFRKPPNLVPLPFLAHPSGFGMTTRPGIITWNKEAGVLEAVSGSDIAFTRARHIYRLDRYDSSTFVLVRVEFRYAPNDQWIPIWEAPQWSILPKPDAR